MSSEKEEELISTNVDKEFVHVRRRSSRIELSDLPNEIIVVVFENAAGEDHDIHDNVAWMGVCQQWRILVLNTWRLWCNISVDTDAYTDLESISGQMLACLRYSMEGPLDIKFTFSGLPETSDENQDENMENEDEPSKAALQCVSVMDLLLGEDGKHAPRWRTLKLWFGFQLEEDLAFHILNALRFPVPNLQELAVYFGYPVGSVTTWQPAQLEDILPDLHQVRDLTVDHRTIFGINSFQPPSVERLVLFDTPVFHEFLTIGADFTNLRRLEVDIRDFNVVNGREVAIPSLRELKASGSFTAELIAHFISEGLVHLDIADGMLNSFELRSSAAYRTVKTLRWRTRDNNNFSEESCPKVELLAFILAQCHSLVELQIWKRHVEWFKKAMRTAKVEYPGALSKLETINVYSNGWEFSETTWVKKYNESEMLDLSM